MSRLDELKKQYPELNVTLFDMMTRLDTSKTYKYLPLMCKIFGQRYNPKKLWHKDDYSGGMLEIQSMLISKGISTDNLTDSQMYYMANYITENFSRDIYQTLIEFMAYMDKGHIINKDISEYKDIDDVRGAVTLASMKELTKDLEGQVIKEFEDEKWVVVRPLTFSASVKYGASTRWCTTYQKEKQYFEKYWRKGILVYFINKETGYKFAGFKGLQGDSEFSFWNAEDTRIDYLDVDADEYLFPIVRRIFKSEETNKNLCSDEIQRQVHDECLGAYEKMRIERIEMEIAEAPAIMEQPVEIPIEELNRMGNQIAEQIDGDIRDRLIEAIRDLDEIVTTEPVQVERQVRELRFRENGPTMRA